MDRVPLTFVFFANLCFLKPWSATGCCSLCERTWLARKCRCAPTFVRLLPAYQQSLLWVFLIPWVCSADFFFFLQDPEMCQNGSWWSPRPLCTLDWKNPCTCFPPTFYLAALSDRLITSAARWNRLLRSCMLKSKDHKSNVRIPLIQFQCCILLSLILKHSAGESSCSQIPVWISGKCVLFLQLSEDEVNTKYLFIFNFKEELIENKE